MLTKKSQEVIKNLFLLNVYNCALLRTREKLHTHECTPTTRTSRHTLFSIHTRTPAQTHAHKHTHTRTDAARARKHTHMRVFLS